jgi:hypothetical protein
MMVGTENTRVESACEPYGNEPRAWQITARRLIRAANVLYEDHRETSVHDPLYASVVPILVLYGLATENLVKALLATQGWPYRHDPRLNSHHLAWLFEQAQVSLGAKDVGILERLQSFLDKARYPEETTPARETGDDVAQVLHLLTRLEDALAVSRPEKVLPRINLFGLGLPSS